MEHGKFIAAEPGELEQFSTPWDLLIDSPGASEPCADLEFFAVPGVTVMRETYLRPARLLGMPPPNELVLGIPIGSDRGSTTFGNDLVRDQIYALSGAAMEATYQRHQEVLAIHLDLTHEFDDLLGLAVDRLAARDGSLTIGETGPETALLARKLARVFAQSAQWRNGMQTQVVSLDLASILDAITDAILPDRLDGVDGKTSGQTRAVASALEFLRAASDCTSVAELCTGAGLNQRTLERGVRAQFGCTVVQLLKKWRLHKARHELSRSDPSETTVSRIAASRGFYDFGRFASLYSDTFGEYPSETLAAATAANVIGPLVKGPAISYVGSTFG